MAESIIKIDLADYKASVDLMDNFGDSKYPFSGTNSDGERTLTSISRDNITMMTMQHNGWCRTNILNRDGTCKELFEKFKARG